MNTEILSWWTGILTVIITLLFGGILWFVRDKIEEVMTKLNFLSIKSTELSEKSSDIKNSVEVLRVKVLLEIKSLNEKMDQTKNEIKKLESLEASVIRMSSDNQHIKEKLAEFGKVKLK